jgi:hypothetical protein
MPFETSFDPRRRLMITRASGGITLADLRAYQQELGQRPEFDATWAHIFDARDAARFDVSSADIRALSETSVLATSARRAMVATNPAIFGEFRMYATSRQLRAGGSEIGVFKTLEEAIEWVTSLTP